MPLEIVGLIFQELSPRDLMNAHLAFSKDLKPSSKKIAFVIADTFYRNYYLHGSHLGLASSSQIIEDLITIDKKIKDSLKFGSISIKLNYKVDRTEVRNYPFDSYGRNTFTLYATMPIFCFPRLIGTKVSWLLKTSPNPKYFFTPVMK